MTFTTYATQKLPEEKVFKDPIHRYIHVRDQVIWDLIKTKEFQRLRRIKQLGTLYLSFHTAEHSRFGHSLGVYEIVRRLIDDSFNGREAWNNEDRPLALCAALLHDLGHGPFLIVSKRYLTRIMKHLHRQLLRVRRKLTKY